jgi:tRNA (guanosine-2'-O-)-methyltransferase
LSPARLPVPPHRHAPNYKGFRVVFQYRNRSPLARPDDSGFRSLNCRPGLWYIWPVPTPERIEKVSRVLSLRQPDLRVVLEGVTIAHNASAVIRTCDAAGILHLDLISPNPELIRFNEAITTGADKWLEIGVHGTAAECFSPLKKDGFTIIATHPEKEAVPYTDVDYTQPLVLVFGSESEGISAESLAFADKVVRIPMLGMVQSLNLSVSVAVILYEALRQRAVRGFLENPRLPNEEFVRLKKKWLRLSPEE